ncbi:MAG: DUF2167 domain-containing protein [Planctomycetota bacterium]
MKPHLLRLALSAVCLWTASPTPAQDPPQGESAAVGEEKKPQDPQKPGEQDPAKPPSPFAKLTFESGRVHVKGDIATLDLPAGWQYLQQQQARFVVEQVWGNPPRPSTLGLVAPPGFQEMQSDWAIIVSFEEEGYVKDDDAGSIDYSELLSTMQKGATEANTERKKQGYPTLDIVGWAEQPHYDATEKKLYWAKSLRFEGEPGLTLNYDVRVLGRRGVLVMQAVASVDDLQTVAAGCKQVLAGTEFATGHRYSDFDGNIDKVAAYGIGGLIAGKILLKAGLLKLLLKPLLIGGALIIGLFAKLLGGKKAKAEGPARDTA